MADRSAIEWTDATWNPLVGCSRVSEGCQHCYAERHAYRFSGGPGVYEGTARLVNGHPTFTGRVNFNARVLDLPLRWKRPRRIFVNSMSDLFHENVPDETRDRIFAVMTLCPQHTFQVLTKRAMRMRDYCASDTTSAPVADDAPRPFAGLTEKLEASGFIGGDSEAPERADAPEAIARGPELPSRFQLQDTVRAQGVRGTVSAVTFMLVDGMGKVAYDVDCGAQTLHRVLSDDVSTARPEHLKAVPSAPDREGC